MADNGPILVTGAAGQLGAVGRTVCGLLLDRGLPVRAMVRREDDRAAALRAVGAEVVVGDLLEPADVYRVVSGCRRVYFGMSVSAGYLEATVTMAVVAREVGVDAVVNMSLYRTRFPGHERGMSEYGSRHDRRSWRHCAIAFQG